jgi:DNA (cytosine-5)-methyltransferase 1
MKLYEEIIFLKHHSICPYVVENVKPYYEPLIPWKMIQRHLFWSNFDIPDLDIKKDNIRTAQIADLEAHHWFDLSKYKLPNKRQILRNCVYPEVWLHVLNNISEHKTHK